MKKNINKPKNQKGPFAFFCVMFIALCVFLAIECATSNSEITKLIDSQDLLIKEKKELTLRLVEVSSLNVIQEKASSLGFNEPQKVVYIQKSDEYVGLLP